MNRELYLPDSGRSFIVADGTGAERDLPVAVRASSNFALTHSSRRLIRGEYSARITSPGMMNTQPGITGKISPTMPISTRPTPALIRRIFLKRLPPFAALRRFRNFYLALFSTRTL